jgi:hypothetical protein
MAQEHDLSAARLRRARAREGRVSPRIAATVPAAGGRRQTNPFLFIVGCPRSGTSVLHRMLDAHREIAMLPEIEWTSRWYDDRVGLTADGFVTPSLIDGLLARGLGRFTPLPMTRAELEEVLESEKPLPYADLVAMLFDRYGDSQGKRFVGEKTAPLDGVQSVGTLHQLWPEAKFVHLVRDGRDVALSAVSWRKAERLASAFATWSTDPIATAAVWWEWQVRVYREAGRAVGDGLYYELRYESLVHHPAEECAALCAFLGVPYDGAMLRFHERKDRAASGLDAKHAWLPATPGLRDWRAEMPSEDVRRFEASAGALLEELGYARGAPDPDPELVQYASSLREAFEGRPLPTRWEAAGPPSRTDTAVRL